MRTSEQVYHRVRWDARFDQARFTFGVAQRGAGVKRVPMVVFDPAEVPWHRVLFVEADGEVVWDRASGVDRVEQSAAGRVRSAGLLRPPFFDAGAPHAWRPLDGWRPGPGTAAPGGSLRVLTWNTLWDKYNSDLVDTARRRPLLLAELQVADADVIALQEVEPALAAMLAAAPWVRERYAFDTSPTSAAIGDTGLLLLSRVPVRESGRHAFSRRKGLAAITVETSAGPVVVVNTHLTSDHSANGAARRRGELAEAAEVLSGVDGEVVVVGDFNDGGALPASALGARDAWVEAAAGTGATFDPATNPLAALGSLTGRSSRLDRVLLRGSARVESVALVGDVPTAAGLFASDHYGVRADLVPGAVERSGGLGARRGSSPGRFTSSVRTAVVWLPPQEVMDAVGPVRAEHDRGAGRWPAHVTLLFGFVPEADFDEAVPLLARAVGDVPPFDVRLAGVRTFGEDVVWLDPAADGEEPWRLLHAALVAAFPGGRREFTPHLTLGRSVGALPAARALGEFRGRVGELAVVSRRGAGPMVVRAVVPLGGGEPRWVSEVDSAEPVDLGARAEEVVRWARGVGEVHVVGSRATGCALPDADLDLVAVVPGEPGRLPGPWAPPGAVDVRVVNGARGPGVRAVVEPGLGVDIAVVGSGVVPVGEAVARRAETGGEVALGAVGDVEAIRAAVSGFEERFTALAREVKAWARLKGLDSAPFGGLPGVAWAVLAAVSAREADDDPLTHFFGTWAAWDWRRAVSLDGDAGPARGAMTVLTPGFPARDCAEQVGEDFLELLTAELYRAWEFPESRRERPELHRRHRAWAIARADDAGRLRGRVRVLLDLLAEAGAPDAHAWPRPVGGGFAVGLGRTPPDAVELARVAGEWAVGLRGGSLRWHDGGELEV
ncbi:MULTISPECIES: RNA repair domain-containing protein [Actinosynnema]|uniref:RNA repair domain-containing protein n=1 Tax=Actinosynnema TaxID=40566 RepID=UPI0020A27CF5|nr:RNA repair domain-containing protein [Actinosynnema pretiosum]MCP2098495.1 Metal-dependent hydrolase, endonuclease/exonuclease/phosphatase family [Actinosynnema pretiosum]